MMGVARGPLVRGSLILMESLWVYALVAFFVAATVDGSKPTLLGVVVVVGGSWTISRFLQASDLSLTPLRIWGTLLSIILFYAVVRVDFYGNFALWDFNWLDSLINDTRLALAAGTTGSTAIIGVPLLFIFWMRGILSAQQSVDFSDVFSSFAIGFAVIASVLVFGSLVDELPRGVELIAVPYVAVGLMALGLEHASKASDSFDRESTPSWLVAIMAGVVGMGLIALLFVVIDFGLARDGLEAAAFGFGWVFAGVLTILIWPIFRLLEGAFWLVDFISGGLDARDDPLQVETQPGEPREPEEAGDNALPGWVRDVVRYGMGAFLLALVALGFALSFRRLRRTPGPADDRESVYTEGRLAADLGNLFGSMFRRRFGSRSARSDEPVRRLYFDMLDAAEKRGVERRPTETPLDLVPRIHSAFNSVTPDEITNLFDDVRYGGMGADSRETQRLRAQWEQLQGP